jgi:hypothetical protein
MAADAARETGFGTGLLAHIEGATESPVRESGPVEGVRANGEVPPAGADGAAPEPVAEREDDAAERERRLLEREAALEAALRRLAEREAALEAAAAAEPPVPQRPVGALLRERAEREGERLWRAFDAALDATFPDGRPDVRTRLEAAETLLAQLELADAVTPPDELALRRDLRLGRMPG